MSSKDEGLVRRYPLKADETPSEGVFSVVAAIENCSPLDLAPLAEATDPDALDAFLVDSTETNRVAFEYEGYEVTVTQDEVLVALSPERRSDIE